MLTVARVLVLAACVPLLQPAGVCACGALRAVPVRAPQPAPAPAAADACQKKCCGHKSAPPALAAQPLAPPSGDHLPACPASPGADAEKWIEPSSTAGAPAVAVLLPFPFEPALALATPRTLPQHVRAAGVPGFLAHTRLRI